MLWKCCAPRPGFSTLLTIWSFNDQWLSRRFARNMFGFILLQSVRFALNQLERLIQIRWDVIHRSIRDVKLSLLHGSNGEFLQSQLHSQYLFSMSYRPFGSGGFAEDKKRALELMLARETPDSLLMFREVWETIREEMKMPPNTSPSQVWAALPSLPGFLNKQTLPKLSRWFSWNQSAEENLPQWTSLKLVLGYHFEGQGLDPDEAYQKRQLDALAREQKGSDQSNASMRKQFSQLKQRLGGGLKLCYHLMSNKLLQMVNIISVCTRPIWTWYADSVKDVQNAEDQVNLLVTLSQTWGHEPHLSELAAVHGALTAPRDMQLMQLLRGSVFEDTAEKVSELTGHLLKHRAWSLSKASTPPDCYAGLLSEDNQLGKASGLKFGSVVARLVTGHWAVGISVSHKYISTLRWLISVYMLGIIFHSTCRL